MCETSHRGMELATPAAHGTGIWPRGGYSAAAEGGCTITAVAQARSPDPYRRRHRADVRHVLDLLALDFDDQHLPSGDRPIGSPAACRDVGVPQHVHVRDA